MTKNAAFARPGNTNTLKTGKNSARVKVILAGLAPATCRACNFRNCPERVQSADSVCAFHEHLCQLGDMLLDHSPSAIQEYLASKIKVDSYRYQRALLQEAQDAMGLDPDVMKLSASINRDLRLLAQISMPQLAGGVHVDNRSISIEVQQAAAQMTEDQQQRALQAIIDLRALPEGDKLASEILCGRDPRELAAVIVDGEVVDDD